MEITSQIWLIIGFMVYYTLLQIYDGFSRVCTTSYTKSIIIEKLRSKYNVPIKTFRARHPLGFASFKAVWINQSLLFKANKVAFVFHHEYYHLKNHHKAWILFSRFIISISPLAAYFVNWGAYILILLTLAYSSEIIRQKFEAKANNYAKKMTANDATEIA